MPLTLRPTKLETSPVYAHLKDYTVFEDGTEIGRMYEQRPPAPPGAAWLWKHHRDCPPAAAVIVPGRARGRTIKLPVHDYLIRVWSTPNGAVVDGKVGRLISKSHC
jgi:hypothetical protein